MKYFDYAATTPTSEEALKAYVDVSQKIYGNPGSSTEAADLQEKIREGILKSIGLNKSCNLIFTSGGTEANNLAIKGIVKSMFPKGSHFITSKIEHASVYEVFKKLENGNKVTYIGCDKNGIIDIEEYKASLRPTTKFVSFMHVNNEVGTRQPISELYKVTKEYNKNIVFMTDTIQGLGKVQPLNIIPDILTISSHKIYGPKSVGAVIVKKEYALANLILGGTKEGGQRAGTQSLPAQAAFYTSVKKICTNLEEILHKVTELRKYLEEELTKIDGVSINAQSDSNVVSIFINIDMDNRQGIKFLFENDILLSAKSADSNNKASKSRTLKAMGYSDYICDRTYRISLSHLKTKKDIDYLITKIKLLIKNSDNTKLKLITNNEQLKESLNLREEVFVKEQKIEAEKEFDNNDDISKEDMHHFNLYKDDKVIGTLRAKVDKNYIKFSRVAIKKDYRGKNYGKILLSKVMAELDKYAKDYYVESQFYAKDFYKNLGFIQYGQEFFILDIKHVKLIKPYDVFRT